MNATTLRRLWSVIEETQTPIILSLNDSDLTQQLLHQLQNKCGLSQEEMQAVHCYLDNRLSLIRDMAIGSSASPSKVYNGWNILRRSIKIENRKLFVTFVSSSPRTLWHRYKVEMSKT